MCNRDGTVWIAFNGQIYNYRQLRNELKAQNYEFSSNSDTEVIIHGYQEWGIDRLLERLRGMFAFAIYDLRFTNPKLILARDRFGIKPLYYYQDNEQVVFSSEVGAIVKSGCISIEKNRETQILFLIFGNIPTPLTTIKNIFSFPAASYLSIEDSNKKLVKYYNLVDYIASIDSCLKIFRKIPKPLLTRPLKNMLSKEIVFRKTGLYFSL